MMASQSTMIPETPIYCPVCGDDGVDNSSTVSLDMSSRADIFQCFLKLFGAKWSGEAFSFCEECRSQLSLISQLERELRELKQKLTKCGKELGKKLECSEAAFERRSLYSKDRRYFKLRKQILGDKISKPEARPSDCLKETKKASKMEQPLVLEYIKVEIDEPEDTELYPNLDDDDSDNHEQIEESDQPQMNEDSFQNTTTENSPGSHQQPQRMSMRKRRRKIVIDPPSEEDEEDVQKTTPPPRSQRSHKRKSEATSDSSSSSEEDNSEEYTPNEPKKPRKKVKSRKQQVVKNRNIITIHNIQLIRVSEEEDQYKCSECDVIISSKRKMLRTHVIKEHTTRFQCSECFKRFAKPSQLSSHMESHRKSTTPQYSCPICSRPFFRAVSIKSHVWSHYSEQDKAEALARGEKLPERFTKKSFMCEWCPRSFATILILEKHSKEKHPDNKKGEKELCGLCGAWVVHLKDHMRSTHVAEEDKKFECGICKKRFLHNSLLITHRKAHSNEKPFQCDVCGKELKSERSLKEHRLGHEDVKPFNCHICGLGFTRAKVLKRHIGNVHRGLDQV